MANHVVKRAAYNRRWVGGDARGIVPHEVCCIRTQNLGSTRYSNRTRGYRRQHGLLGKAEGAEPVPKMNYPAASCGVSDDNGRIPSEESELLRLELGVPLLPPLEYTDAASRGVSTPQGMKPLEHPWRSAARGPASSGRLAGHCLSFRIPNSALRIRMIPSSVPSAGAQ
jgi:hypothetical protein